MLLQKKQIVTAVAGVALLTGMGISVKAAFAQSSTSPSTTPATSPTTAPITSPTTAPTTSPTIAPRTQNRTVMAEKHPDLRAALRHLKLAKTELQKGAHDFQGERVEALKDTDKAIADIEKALKIDRR
jgi:hypothetical protein